jgi:hypothetical protein
MIFAGSRTRHPPTAPKVGLRADDHGADLTSTAMENRLPNPHEAEVTCPRPTLLAARRNRVNDQAE